MKKAIIFIVLSLFWIVLLFPKYILWDKFTQIMNRQNISIITQKKDDLRYKFTASSIKVFFQSVQIATIKKAEMKPWIFYNEIDLQDAKISKNLPLFKEFKIKNLRAIYSIFSPKKIEIKGTSNLGNFRAEVDIFKHKGYILFKNINSKNSVVKSYFKKTKEGMKYELAY
ncbi:MAG: hypothetical protein QM482_09195 [Sulfurospirillum sp.]